MILARLFFDVAGNLGRCEIKPFLDLPGQLVHLNDDVFFVAGLEPDRG